MTLDSTIDLGRVESTSIGEAASSVIARITGASAMENEETGPEIDDQPEQLGDVDLWSHAPLIYRPLAPNDDGACEALFSRTGDTRDIIATKDRRYQVSVEEGEVVLRNVVADASKRATVTIKANGEVIIDSPKIYVGTASATEKIALGTAIKGHLDGIKTFLDLVKTHTHPVAGAVANASVVLAGGSPSVPGVESRHVVEGA